LLIGIVKENAIMIVDFAVEAEREESPERAEGEGPDRARGGPLPAE